MNLSHLKTPSENCHESRESGIALISVLWTLLLLSALAGAAAYVARCNSILTHRLGELAQAEAVADAAIVNAISKLSDNQLTRHPAVDGQPYAWEFLGIQATVAISNEAGRIDLNSADDDLILGFLNSRGLSEDRATTLLGDLRSRQHASIARTHDGTLRTTEELRQIPSWKAQALDCWMNSLTVYTGLPGISLSAATEQTKEAMKWAKEHHIGGRDWAAMRVESPNSSLDRSVLGEVLRIEAKVSLTPNISASSEWVGRVTGEKHQPALTLRWSHGGIDRSSLCKKS
jgi:hypothetical protein